MGKLLPIGYYMPMLPPLFSLTLQYSCMCKEIAVADTSLCMVAMQLLRKY